MEPISSFSEPGFALISHPDRTLLRHLAGCDESSKLALSFKYVSEPAFFDKRLLETMRHLLVYFHDFGKATIFFQHKIIAAIYRKMKTREDGDKKGLIEKFEAHMRPYLTDFRKSGKAAAAEKALDKNQSLANHALLGAYFVQAIFKNGDPMLGLILLKAIRRHHGDLTNFWVTQKSQKQIELTEDEAELLETQLENFDFELYQSILDGQNLIAKKGDWHAVKAFFEDGDNVDDIREDFQKKKDIRYFLLQHYLFSLLLSADKGDMQIERDHAKGDFLKENRLLPTDLIDGFKKKKFGDGAGEGLNARRESAYRLIAENCRKEAARSFFSITLPTGMGKTFAAYNAAVILQNAFAEQTGGAKPRIVYCLPFTSIIDQNAAILEEIMVDDERTDESWLSRNHYLSTYNERYDATELVNQEAEYLADGWEQEVIVTTFVQLLESIFTNKNRSLRKFHNMTNAVFVLDEVQNVPPKYYEAIELLFRKMAECFNTKFVFVTATQPFLFKDPAGVFELTEGDTEGYFRDLKRIKIDQSLLRLYDYKPMKAPDFLEILVADLRAQPKKSFLVILNTIRQSQEFFDALAAEFPDDELIYLSSSILPVMRQWAIRNIKRASGKRKIVVSTQVVEAGVDIDLDVVYRDFAPIDSLNQSAGRCNRNAKKGTGTVRLFNLGKHRRIYDNVLMDITEKTLRGFGDEILEGQIFDLNLAYAAAVRKKITDENDASQKLIRNMERLELEDIEKDFVLIEDDRRHYNVFLPCCLGARNVWAAYLLLGEIKDNFERKTALKKLKPKLLKYVTRFPKTKYEPTNPDKFLIHEPNWANWYDLERGFKLNAKDEISFIA